MLILHRVRAANNVSHLNRNVLAPSAPLKKYAPECQTMDSESCLRARIRIRKNL